MQRALKNKLTSPPTQNFQILVSLRQEFRGTNAVFPAACFCFCFPCRSLPPDSCSTSSFSLAILSVDSASRGFAGSSSGRGFSAWERSRCGRHAHWGRRTAHAKRWRAWRPENRGSPCSPPACVIPPGAIWAVARASPAHPSQVHLRADRETSSWLREPTCWERRPTRAGEGGRARGVRGRGAAGWAA